MRQRRYWVFQFEYGNEPEGKEKWTCDYFIFRIRQNNLICGFPYNNNINTTICLIYLF